MRGGAEPPRNVLITGCSSGIGYAAAHGLRAAGWRVFASCRKRSDCARLMEVAEDLGQLGLGIESFGGTAIAVRETPAILGTVDARAMVLDILDELTDQNSSNTVQARIEAILSRVACHGSVRSGRRMRAEEMNALLREMEATPHSGQCNHGRPTYVELKLSDIERLFGRT